MMRIPRLFIDAPLQPGASVTLPDAAAAHASRVLRLRAGDPVALFNGDGRAYPARLEASNGRAVTARIESSQSCVAESPLRVTLAQALARGEKMDWIVQKATELGVAEIAPLATARSEVRLGADRAIKRTQHWRAVAIAACEQSGRCVVPEIHAPQSLVRWLATLDAATRTSRWMLHPEDGQTLRTAAPGTRAVLVVGPEGGLDGADVEALHAAGFRGLSLGPRILRTETAGIAALAALQALYGDA